MKDIFAVFYNPKMCSHYCKYTVVSIAVDIL